MGASSHSGEPFQPAIAGFFCQKCGEKGLSRTGEMNGEYPDSLKSVRIICAEKVSSDLIKQAFQYGADGVLICGCLVGNCESRDGNAQVLAHIHQSKMVLKEMGLEQGRLRQEWICAPGIENLPEIIEDFVENVRKLGPCRVAPSGVIEEKA